MKIFAAAGYLTYLGLSYSYNKDYFTGLTRSEHLLKTVTYYLA